MMPGIPDLDSRVSVPTVFNGQLKTNGAVAAFVQRYGAGAGAPLLRF